jgi:hypothetical protein
VSIFSCAGSENNKNVLVYYDGTKWNIELTGKRVPLVNLLIDNTQDKKLVPEIWNGEYKIVSK